MLNETSESLCIPLCILFSHSLNEVYYPSSWKLAHVMPLFIKGNKDEPSNYRPISLISCVGKVMERIIFKHVYTSNYLQTNSLIYQNQSGFFAGNFTEYQLIDIYNQICKAFESKESTCINLYEISKAFDSLAFWSHLQVIVFLENVTS
jgi:hypothetical protein